MRILKLCALLLLVVPVAFALAAPGVEGTKASDLCNPRPRSVGPLHIAYINCLAEEDEVVTVLNGGAQQIDLTGYVLTNKSTGRLFAFEKTPVNSTCCTLGPYEIFRVHSGLRNFWSFDSAQDLHWLRRPGVPEVERIWSDEGDAARLIDPQGRVVDVYMYGQP